MIKESIQACLGYLDTIEGKIFYNAVAITSSTIITAGEELCQFSKKNNLKNIKFYLAGRKYDIASYEVIWECKLILLSLSSSLEIKQFPLLGVYDKKDKLQYCLFDNQKPKEYSYSDILNIEDLSTTDQQLILKLSGVPILKKQISLRKQIIGIFKENTCFILLDQEIINKIMKAVNIMKTPNLSIDKSDKKSMGVNLQSGKLTRMLFQIKIPKYKPFITRVFFSKIVKSQQCQYNAELKPPNWSYSNPLFRCLCQDQENKQNQTKYDPYIIRLMQQFFRLTQFKDGLITYDASALDENMKKKVNTFLKSFNQSLCEKKTLAFSQYVAGQTVNKNQRYSCKQIIGSSINQMIKTIQQLLPQNIRPDRTKFKDDPLNLSHKIAISLGGENNFTNVMINNQGFNKSTMRKIEINIESYLKVLQKQSDLYKSLKYIVETQNINFKDKNGYQFYLSLFPSVVNISQQLIKQNGDSIQTFKKSFNPYMSTQDQQYKQDLKKILDQINLLNNVPTLQKKQLQSEQDQNEQAINDFIKEQYSNNKNIIQQNLKDNKLTLDSEVFNVQVTPETIAQPKQISIDIKDKCEMFLQKTFKINFLKSLMENTVEINRLKLSIKQQVFGYYLYIQTKDFKIPDIILKALSSIFNMNQPTINLNANILLLSNFLGSQNKPSFFSIGANIQGSPENKDSPQNKDTIADIDYTFQSINLDLYCSLDDSADNYKIDWIIGSKMKIYNLTKEPIQAISSFGCVSSQYKLTADVRFKIQNFLNIVGLSIDGLEIYINFSPTKSLFLKILLNINDVGIMIGGECSKEEIQFVGSIQSLTMADIQQLIYKLSQIQIKSGVQLIFEDIQLEVKYDRIKKKFSYDFQITVKIQQTIFQGKLSYDNNNLTLQAKADIIKFSILGKQFALIQPSLGLQQSQNMWQLKYTGEINYKSQIEGSEGSESNVKTTINVQKQNNQQAAYYLAAEIQLSQEKKIQGCISLFSSSITTLKFVYITDNYKMKDKKGKKYFQASLKQYKLLGHTVDLNIACFLQPLTLEGKIDFESKDDSNSFIVFKSATISAVFQGTPAVTLALTCFFPNYNDIALTGNLIIQVGKIAASLSMIGKVKICDYISIGYDKNLEDKKSTIQIFILQEGFEFKVASQLQIFDTNVGGSITIIDNSPTAIEFSLENFDLSGLINFMKKLIANTEKKSDPQSVKQCSKLLVINTISFNYDILKPYLYVDIDIIILDNDFKLKVEYIGVKSFTFTASIQKPIAILDVIFISSDSDDKKGPSFNMSIDQNNGFNLSIDCKLIFGPITESAKVDIYDLYLSAEIKLKLFTVQYDASVLLDKANNNYQFSVKFNEKQMMGATDFVKGLVVDKENFKSQAHEQNNQEDFFALMQAQSSFHRQYQQHKNQAKNHFIKTRQIMSNIYKYHNAEKLSIARQKRQKLQKQKKDQIQKMKQELRNTKNYLYHTQNDRNKSTKLLEPENKDLQGIKLKKQLLQAKIKEKQSITTPLWQESEELHQDIDELYRCINQYPRNLQGGWDSFVGWVKDAYNTVAKVVKGIIDEVLPIITYFEIGGSIKQNNGWNFHADFSLSFKFLGKEHEVSYNWDTHFDQKIIHQTAISKMVNISLEVVKSVYIIPKPIYQTFKDKMSLQQIYQEMKNQKIIGINIQYQPQINFKDQGKNFYLDLKIGAVAALDISKITGLNSSEKQYNLSISKHLQYRLTKRQNIVLKQQAIQVFFCDYLYPKTQLLKQLYSSNSVSKLNDYLLVGPRQMRGIIWKPSKQDKTRIAQWAYQSIYDSINTEFNQDAIRLFKSIEVVQDKQIYTTYQFKDDFIMALIDGTEIKLVKKYESLNDKRISFLWKEIPVIAQIQPDIS